MRSLLILLVCTEVLAIALFALALSSPNGAYPTGYGDDSCAGNDGALVPLRREVYDNGRIIDITHKFTPDTPGGEDPDEGIGEFLSLSLSMKNGSLCNFSVMKLPVHAGTHVDAPGHVFDHYFDAGFDIDSLDLEVLNGINYLGFFPSMVSTTLIVLLVKVTTIL